MVIVFEIVLIFIIIFYLIFSEINKFYIQIISLSFSMFLLIFSVLQLNTLNNNNLFFQDFIMSSLFSFMGFELLIGLDGISSIFTILTTFLIFICLIINYNNPSIKIKEYYICFFLLELFLILTFNSLNLLFFYIFFESTLIPMYFIIGIWGSKTKKTRAAFLFFIYTFLGSLVMLYALIYIYVKTGTLNYHELVNYPFSTNFQEFFWLAFFLAFSVKIPVVPFHIWLPEAHVEAPTTGSIILAGILLKLGIFGFLKFSFVLFPFINFYFKNLIYFLGSFSIIYASILAFRQNDIKKLVAYASIAHMNMILLGIFSFNKLGIDGALLQTIAHCFTAGGLFLCAGNLYERYHTRLIKYYGGLDKVMPNFSKIFFIYILANMSFPGTLNFIGEFLILKGVFSSIKLVATIAAVSLFLSVIYSLLLYNKVVKGPVNSRLLNSKDLTRNEISIHLVFLFLIIFLGFFPSTVLNLICSQTFFILNFYF